MLMRRTLILLVIVAYLGMLLLSVGAAHAQTATPTSTSTPVVYFEDVTLSDGTRGRVLYEVSAGDVAVAVMLSVIALTLVTWFAVERIEKWTGH